MIPREGIFTNFLQILFVVLTHFSKISATLNTGFVDRITNERAAS